LENSQRRKRDKMNPKFLLTLLILFLVNLQLFSAPQLIVDGKTEIDFGEYPAEQSKMVVVNLLNKGDSFLKIERIVKECACTVLDLKSNLILPGDSLPILIKLVPNYLSGPFNKKVRIITNDPTNKELVITLKGDAKPLIKVEENDYIFEDNIPTGVPKTFSFIIDKRESTTTLETPQINSNYKLSFAEEKISPTRSLLKFTATPLREGKLNADITLLLKQEKNYKLKLHIRGDIGKRIFVSPEIVKVPSALTSFSVKLKLYFTGFKKNEVSLTKISTPDIPGVKVKKLIGNNSDIALQLDCNMRFLEKLKEDNIKIQIQYDGCKLPATTTFELIK
jgi:hypothetical protein